MIGRERIIGRVFLSVSNLVILLLRLAGVEIYFF